MEQQRHLINGEPVLTKPSRPPESWPDSLNNGSEMAGRILSRDWSRTALGPIESWPAALRTALGMCLSTRFPMYIYWGPDRLQFYNDAGIWIMGTRHPDTAMGPVSEVFPEIWPVIKDMFDHIEQTGEPSWSENQLLPLQRNGFAEECYFTFSYSPIRDDSGLVVGFYTCAMETTGHVLGQRRLRTLQAIVDRAAGTDSIETVCAACLGALGENAQDMPFASLYLVDEARTTATLNTACGHAPDGFRPPGHVDMRSPGKEALASGIAAALRSGRAELLADPIAHPPGRAQGTLPHVRPHVLVLPLKSAEGVHAFGAVVIVLSGYLAFTDDYRSFLELAAGAMGRAISSVRSQQEVRERAEQLAALDQAKTAFFNNVSHEFRTPLTLMTGPLEDALADPEYPLPARQRARLALVQRNTSRLMKLVNTLLEFSRLEAGRVHAQYEPTDLASLTADLASHFRSAVERAGLAFSVETPALAEPVYVDREMWEKIVFNLLSNALKFTFTGSITVSLRQKGSQTSLVVRDTGTGIPDSELPNLFKRFHRVEGAQGRSHEGSGIGLAFIQELVKLHGGNLTVQSVVGQGSAFTVTLPCGYAHLPPENLHRGRHDYPAADIAPVYLGEALGWVPQSQPHADAGNQTGAADPLANTFGLRSDGEKRRILLADDNYDLRSYVSDLLTPWFEVEAVADGQAAIEAIGRNKPDLVLSDVMMPRLDGISLLRTIRDNPATHDLSFILVSARTGEEAAVGAIEAGADDYLTKPFSARDLLARVKTRLQIDAMRREVVRQSEALAARSAQAEWATTLLDSSPLALLLLEPEAGCITFANKVADEMAGGSFPCRVPLKEYHDVYRMASMDDRPLENDLHPVARAARGEVLRDVEVVWHTPAGRFFLLVNSNILPPLHGYPATVVLALQDVSQQVEKKAEIQRLALYDALTGLPNRRLFYEKLAVAVDKATRQSEHGAIFFIDLDHFKYINDSRGHRAGDMLLKAVSNRLRSVLRTSDTLARLGGDEFLYIMTELGPDAAVAAQTARQVGNRILGLLKQPFEIDGFTCTAPASIGITLFPKAGEASEALLEEADIAMYRGKSAGRNRAVLFESAMRSELTEQLAITNDLQHALHSARLQLYLQPQVGKDGRPRGAELLLRWLDPNRGFVPPAVFIPVAEQSDLILELGTWVIEQGCLAQTRLHAAALDVPVSINVSPRQFHHPMFVEHVRNALGKTGADPHRLIFEVTENLLIEDVESTARRMHTLAEIGIRFSIDDFGTGYSSLSYLKRLPLYELKIDRSFIEDLPGDPSDTAITQSILGMASHLGLHAVAEGVETQSQADFLIANGVGAMQGYLFGRPVPIDEGIRALRTLASSVQK